MTVVVRHGVRILVCEAEGGPVRTEQDAIDLIVEATEVDAEVVVIPAARLGDDFFTLSTRVAGEIVQKFVLYGRRLAIVGDISGRLDVSSALRAFIAESNRGRQLWFVDRIEDLDPLLRRLDRHREAGDVAG